MYGVTKQSMGGEVRALLPQLKGEYWFRGRETPGDELLYNRVYYMFAKHKESPGVLKVVGSSEHPIKNKELQPFLGKAERFYQRGTPLTIQEIADNFS